MISTGVKLARLKWLEDKLSRNTALRIGRTGVMCWVIIAVITPIRYKGFGL